MKPSEHTIVSIRAKKQAVHGFEAESRPILKNILFKSPIYLDDEINIIIFNIYTNLLKFRIFSKNANSWSWTYGSLMEEKRCHKSNLKVRS